jgi:hypothetical protein
LEDFRRRLLGDPNNMTMDEESSNRISRDYLETAPPQQ